MERSDTHCIWLPSFESYSKSPIVTLICPHVLLQGKYQVRFKYEIVIQTF